MQGKQTRFFAALIVLAVAAISGCGGGNTITPAVQPQIVNMQDSFSFQITGASNVTQTLTYTWANSKTRSNTNHSSAITGGTATVTVKDNAGTVVYTNALLSTGTFASSVGTAGNNWTIIVTLTNLSGTINFSEQAL